MKAFIFDERTAGRIQQLVERAKVEVISPHQLYGENEAVQRPMFDGQQFASLAQVGILILEITEANPNVNFLLAQAVLQQKPTLCLYQKNHEPRDLLNYLIQRGAPKCITTHAYFAGSLANQIDRFLAEVTKLPSEIDEMPSLKFTLRMTPQVDRYLDWKSKQLKSTKADVLRDWLRLRMNEDEGYWKKKGSPHQPPRIL